MKKRICACLVSGALLLNSSFAFTDLTTDHWAYNVVHQMQGKGIISGFLDNTFQPESSVTRGQFATMLVKTLDLPIRTEPAFFEDLDGHWAQPYVESVAAFVPGQMIGQRSCFLPDEAAVREEVAMTVVKAKGLENKAYSASTLEQFIDKNMISQEAQKYVAIAVENGIMKGNADKTFNPKGRITRAEITALMSNLLKLPSTQTSPVENVVKEESVYVTFKEKYINNHGKYAEVKFTKISDSAYEMYLIGYNEIKGAFGMNREISVAGKEGTFMEDGIEKIKISFNNNVVTIKSLDDKYAVFDGDYQKGIVVSSIEGLEEKAWNATYVIGESSNVSMNDSSFSTVNYKVIGFTLENESEVRFTLSAIVDGKILAEAGKGTLEGNNLVYETENGIIKFTISGTGELMVNTTDSKYEVLNGTYAKQNEEDKFEQYKQMVEGTVLHYGVTLL